MSDEDSPLETTAIRARRHLLPSVSEVVRQLSASHPEADPGFVYRAAREVCRRELDRVKDGLEPAPAAVLVQRASQLMSSPTLLEETAGPASVTMSPFGAGAFRAPRPASPAAPPSPASPFGDLETPPGADEPVAAWAPAPAAPAETASPAPRVDEPFGETMGALDLAWTEGKETPIVPAGPASAAVFGESLDAPERTEEVPTVAPASLGIDPFGATPDSVPFVPFVAVPPRAEGPGEETLRRLDEEAAAVPLDVLSGPSLVPPGEPSPVFRPLPATFPPEPTFSPLVPPDVSEGDGGGLFSPATPVPSVSAPSAGSAAEAAAAGGSFLDEPPLRPVESAGAEPPPKRGIGPIAAVLVLAALAGGGWLLFRRSGPAAPAPQGATTKAKPAAGSEAPAAVPGAAPGATDAAHAAPSTATTATAATAAATAPTATTAPSRTTASSTSPAPLPAAPSSAAPAAPSAGSGSGRAGSFESADWEGPDAFVVHFSSYRERATAEKDAARLGKELDQPTRAVGIELGEKGTWYRVVAGEFATLEQALAYRRALEEVATPNLGHVYRVKSK